MTTKTTDNLIISKETHLHYLKQTITLAKQSPPKPTNFRVGCVIVSYPHSAATSTASPEGQVLSTGYTLELPGNTHAEQCALSKFEASPQTTTSSSTTYLYTSLEPCSLRLSGNTPCVQRIIATLTAPSSLVPRITHVVFGAKEPGTFVQDSKSCQILTEAGVHWEYIPEFETEILSVAMEGHKKDEKEEQGKVEEKKGTRIDDISPEERKRQEALPRNPKKRMFEEPPPEKQV